MIALDWVRTTLCSSSRRTRTGTFPRGLRARWEEDRGYHFQFFESHHFFAIIGGLLVAAARRAGNSRFVRRAVREIAGARSLADDLGCQACDILPNHGRCDQRIVDAVLVAWAA